MSSGATDNTLVSVASRIEETTVASKPITVRAAGDNLLDSIRAVAPGLDHLGRSGQAHRGADRIARHQVDHEERGGDQHPYREEEPTYPPREERDHGGIRIVHGNCAMAKVAPLL